MELEGFTDVSQVLRAGVYALVKNGRVIYVGKSKRMLTRLDQHRSAYSAKRQGKMSWIIENLGIPGLLFDEVHVRPCLVDDLDMLEREMIDRYQPQYNVRLRTAGKLPAVMVIGGVTVPLAPKAPMTRRAIA